MKQYGCSDEKIGHYTCLKTQETFTINGDLEKSLWKKAPRSPRFVDMVTGAPAFWDTQVAALWDEQNFYLAYWIQEPNVKAELTERDSQIYFENDIEVFIGGEDCYYELQLNALGTVYEVFYIWQDAYSKGSRFDIPEFDLFSRQVDVLGGFQDEMRYKKHPRGRRWAFMDWDFPGLQTAVKVQGSLNDESDVDKGWTIELAFPWEGMEILAGKRSLPPQDGDTWRFDFSRFEKLSYNGINTAVSPGWSFNPHGVYDSHVPECFTYVHFSHNVLSNL